MLVLRQCLMKREIGGDELLYLRNLKCVPSLDEMDKVLR